MVVLAVAAPALVGVTLGTGSFYHRIPFGVLGLVIGGAAVLVWRIREGRTVHPGSNVDADADTDDAES